MKRNDKFLLFVQESVEQSKYTRQALWIGGTNRLRPNRNLMILADPFRGNVVSFMHTENILSLGRAMVHVLKNHNITMTTETRSNGSW